MARGSCLCGTVRWAIEEPFEEMSHCHCSMCRKVHGTPFGTYLVGAKTNFQWLGGEDAITLGENLRGCKAGIDLDFLLFALLPQPFHDIAERGDVIAILLERRRADGALDASTADEDSKL